MLRRKELLAAWERERQLDEIAFQAQRTEGTVRYRVLVVDTTKSEDYDVVVGRYKQRAESEAAAEAEVRRREFAARALEGLKFYVYI